MNFPITQHPVFNILPEPGNSQLAIEVILADHYRHRLIAQELLGLSENPDQPDSCENAALIRHYLMTEILQHEKFEEEDFVPMLKRRCLPGDNIDNLAAILMWDHFVDRDNVDPVNSGLESLGKGRGLSDAEGFRASVRRFAAKLWSHIIWENRAIIPLARKRLSPHDLTELGESAVDRRRRSLWPQLYTSLPEGLFGVGSRLG
jgi:hemerythrin-like domain-containing protein